MPMVKTTTYHRRPKCNPYCEAVWNPVDGRWEKRLNERGRRFLTTFYEQWGGRVMGLLRKAHAGVYRSLMSLPGLSPAEKAERVWAAVPAGLTRWERGRGGWSTTAGWAVVQGAGQVLQEYERAHRLPVKYSLNFEMSDGSPVASQDLLSALAVDPDDHRARAKEAAAEALAVGRKWLPPRCYAVLRLYFGLDDGMPKKLSEVAAAFGITRERVRQIILRACEVIRTKSQTGKVAGREV